MLTINKDNCGLQFVGQAKGSRDQFVGFSDPFVKDLGQLERQKYGGGLLGQGFCQHGFT
jgi:hypothetical protein